MADWRTEIVKGGPRTEKTRALWIAAEREWILNDHPASCPLCNGANDPDVILHNHQKRWDELAQMSVEAEAKAVAVRKKYYAGGYHLLVNGVPVRCSAVTATFKNKRSLYRGTGTQKETLQLEKIA